jgi:hypothetical protein
MELCTVLLQVEEHVPLAPTLCSSASVCAQVVPESMSMSQEVYICGEIAVGMSETIRSLAERSLGDGDGITSSSLIARGIVSSWLSLPVKVASPCL